MKSTVYNQTKYYELAFSFINPKKQVNVIKKFVKQFGKRKVRRILDIACGPSLQLREFAKRNYDCVGLDINQKMLGHLKREAERKGLKIKTIKADMKNFQIKPKVDLAFIMMGSIIYFKKNREFLSHLRSVALSLGSGGLYLIENFPLNWSSPGFLKPQSWQIRKEGLVIQCRHQIRVIDPINQTIEQILALVVKKQGRATKFISRDYLKLIFPQELLSLIEQNGQFEFLGFFERDSTRRLDKPSSNNFIVLRKK